MSYKFTKLHTDICSLVINKIKFKDDELLRSIVKTKMMGFFIGDKKLGHY